MTRRDVVFALLMAAGAVAFTVAFAILVAPLGGCCP